MVEVEVTCNNVSDFAEADDAEEAILAARCLYVEHRWGRTTMPITCIFRVDGLVVATTKGRKP